jgi:hypothetical protein
MSQSDGQQPIRTFIVCEPTDSEGWTATEPEAETDRHGRGATPPEAVADYCEQILEDRE